MGGRAFREPGQPGKAEWNVILFLLLDIQALKVNPTTNKSFQS
jgi:hypothetical protein